MDKNEPRPERRDALLHELFHDDAIPGAVEGKLLRSDEVALLFQVSTRTVSEWAKKGLLPSIRTPGGHRRFPAAPIAWLLDDEHLRGSVEPQRKRHDH